MLAHVLLTGQFPDEFLETVERSNKREGIRVERVQQFTKKEQELIKGMMHLNAVVYHKNDYNHILNV